MKSDILNRMLENGIVAVLRTKDSSQLMQVCEALYEGGCTAMEVTMTTPNALAVISEVSKRMGARIVMGVGSVIDDITARMAILAGAEYVVTPVMRPDVVALCRRYGKPVVCGAYTPTEALAAYEVGADLIKIFPADKLGAEYIKAIRAPMPQLEIVPTGGVTADNCAEFIKIGCPAVAAGSSLVSAKSLAENDWLEISRTAEVFVHNIKAARG